MSIIRPVEFNDNIVDIYIPTVSRRYCPSCKRVLLIVIIIEKKTDEQTHKQIKKYTQLKQHGTG